MEVAIVGSGAVGGFLGAKLKRAGFDVTFIARGLHLEKMKERGLRIQSDSETFCIDGTFTEDLKEINRADFIFFTVKSTDTRETAIMLRPFMKAGSHVLTLQNGVDNEEILSEVLGEEKILSGAAYITSKIEEPGVIRQEGPFSLLVGSLHESAQKAVMSLSDLCQSAGIHCKTTHSILTRKWDKLLWNVTFNPLSAVTGASVGEILDDKQLRITAEKALLEAVMIGKACGIEIREKVIDRIFPSAELVRHHKTSMLQDRERGKRMEIDSLCGFFISKSQRLGVDTPVLSTLYAILSSMERRDRWR